MRKRGIVIIFCGAAFLLTAVLAFTASAQDNFPTKPINIICQSAAGAPIDIMARQLAKIGEKEFGQRINVINKAGGSGMVTLGYLMSQPADGYNLATEGTGLPAILQMPDSPYKLSDIDFLVRVQNDPFTLFVNSETPWRNVKEFVEAAKKQKMNVGGYATGSGQQFFMLDFARLAGIEFKWLAYNSGKDALVATMGKNLDATLSNYSVITQGGEKIRTLAISTDKRLPDSPNVPTFKEQGYDLVRYHWRGLYMKKGTPRAVMNRLQDGFRRIMQTAEWKVYMKNSQMLEGYLGIDDFNKAIEVQAAADLRFMKTLGIVK
jgi:putative tricarboxylic transport membrane protein